MKLFVVLLLIIVLLRMSPLLLRLIRSTCNRAKKRKVNSEIDYEAEQPNQPSNKEVDTTAYRYQKKWLFTYNEKAIFYKLNDFAKRNGLVLLAKVRLFDLIEPCTGEELVARWKIQAKHVDFVLCSSNLVAKYVIELDDKSHSPNIRQDRDKFVDEALASCGYKVLHLFDYDETALTNLITE